MTGSQMALNNARRAQTQQTNQLRMQLGLRHQALGLGTPTYLQPQPTDKIGFSAGANNSLLSDISGATTQVKVEKWDPSNKNGNSSLSGILQNQGLDPYKKDSSGQTLIQRVAKANGIKNPNLIQPGMKITVPSLAKGTSNGNSEAANLSSLIGGLLDAFGGDNESKKTEKKEKKAAKAEAKTEKKSKKHAVDMARRSHKLAHTSHNKAADAVDQLPDHHYEAAKEEAKLQQMADSGLFNKADGSKPTSDEMLEQLNSADNHERLEMQRKFNMYSWDNKNETQMRTSYITGIGNYAKGELKSLDASPHGLTEYGQQLRDKFAAVSHHAEGFDLYRGYYQGHMNDLSDIGASKAIAKLREELRY